MSTDEYRVEEWTYAGRRVSGTGKVRQLWIDNASGDEHWFDKLVPGNPALASVYIVHATDEAAVTRGPKAPQFVRVDRECTKTPEWHALDLVADAMVKGERAKRAQQKERPIGELTLDEITALYRRRLAGGMPAANALLAVVLGHITSTRVGNWEGAS